MWALAVGQRGLTIPRPPLPAALSEPHPTGLWLGDGNCQGGSGALGGGTGPADGGGSVPALWPSALSSYGTTGGGWKNTCFRACRT